jgi:hypothetical protein
VTQGCGVGDQLPAILFWRGIGSGEVKRRFHRPDMLEQVRLAYPSPTVE